nr:DUF5988 family protein [Micromonospora sp. DSM 115978]
MTRSPMMDPLRRDQTAAIEVILVGGPANLPAELRAHRVSSLDDRVKVPHHGGYEHFAWDSSVDRTPTVFRWTGRTRIAE